MFQPGNVPAHKGQSTAASPIKDPVKVAAIKELLKDRPRDLALFTLGCNSAFRCGDLLALERDFLNELPDGRIEVVVIERKTRKRRQVVLNRPTSEVLRRHLQTSSGRYVFEGQRGRLSVGYVSSLLKRWCAEVGAVDGRVSSHTLRKTFVRLQHDVFKTKLVTLSWALNHSSERQTMQYMGLLPDDIAAAYENAI